MPNPHFDNVDFPSLQARLKGVPIREQALEDDRLFVLDRAVVGPQVHGPVDGIPIRRIDELDSIITQQAE